ncbi:Zim17-type zinc finger protein [Zostera marina]|uniref:Zim17-type zinc finger protein n=1 Tax=Zostera marina TaxID=29655 RepID=A0A0K9P6H7_ZOSMR|nr:Zim17-type zinc finger protein [Zostera marina]
MEALNLVASPNTVIKNVGARSSSSSSSSLLSIFSPRKIPSKRLISFLPIASRINREDDSEFNNDSSKGTNLVPFLNHEISLSRISKDEAMGLVLSAATGGGWTSGSGMEGPPTPAAGSDPLDHSNVSTLPWSLFTKSPRRRMRVAFTCNVCGQRTTRAINPHAYTDGTVFVQCCGCNIFHKLVDHLNLFHDMKGYVMPDFHYKGDGKFNYWNEDDDYGNVSSS